METAREICRLFVFAGASGSGKSTITRKLAQEGLAEISVSYTTRPKLQGERDGIDYYFVDREEFERLMNGNELAEWAEVHGEYYATGKSWLNERSKKDVNVLFEIDVQGASQLRESMSSVCSIFIVPSTIEVLEQRLRSRKRDNDEQIKRRLDTAKKEFSRINEFDHIIVNDDLDEALAKSRAIIRAANGDLTSFEEAEKIKVANQAELVAYWRRFGESES